MTEYDFKFQFPAKEFWNLSYPLTQQEEDYL